MPAPVSHDHSRWRRSPLAGPGPGGPPSSAAGPGRRPCAQSTAGCVRTGPPPRSAQHPAPPPVCVGGEVDDNRGTKVADEEGEAGVCNVGVRQCEEEGACSHRGNRVPWSHASRVPHKGVTGPVCDTIRPGEPQVSAGERGGGQDERTGYWERGRGRRGMKAGEAERCSSDKQR